MRSEKYFHKCGYPVTEVKRTMGLVVDTFFLDGKMPSVQENDQQQTLN
jgi:hypothetical protein